MSDTTILYCLVHGDKSPFPIEINREKTVGQLKDAIVAKKPHRFYSIDADSLDLWKVEIESRNKEKLLNVQLHDEDALDPTRKISKAFPEERLEEHIHIIIRAPEPGK